jgi:phosphoglycerate dehydrogenase-like enzyme
MPPRRVIGIDAGGTKLLGGVVDEGALRNALDSGHLAGAALDVHEREGAGQISPLAHRANVILTPHIGAGTVDAQGQIGEQRGKIIEDHRAALGTKASKGSLR